MILAKTALPANWVPEIATQTTTEILSQASLPVFASPFSGRENEARGRASEASADQIDFLPLSGLALSSRKGTSSS